MPGTPINIIPNLASVKTTHVKINNGTNGGFPFLVKISKGATVSINQARQLLNEITLRLKRAPYHKFLKGKSINVWIVSQEDLKEMGYCHYPARPPDYDPTYASVEECERFQPRFPLGVYDPRLDAVLIDAESINKSPMFNLGEILMHEFLHAYSTSIIEKGKGNLEVRCGLHVSIVAKDTWELISSEGRYLNEALTDYLRIRAGGTIPKGLWKEICQTVFTLVGRRIREEDMFDAYFNGNIEKIRSAINSIHGPEAYNNLSFLLDAFYTGSSRLTTEGQKDRIIGFVKYGFEYYIMKEWNYNPETSSLAPRQLSPTEIPMEMRDILKGIKIFTNLTKEQLKCFFNNLHLRNKHLDELSFVQYTILEDIIERWTDSKNEFSLVIKYVPSLFNPSATMYIRQIEYPDHPHCLGRGYGRESISRVKIH